MQDDELCAKPVRMFLQEHFSIATWAVRLNSIVRSVPVGTLLRFDVRLHFSWCWLLWSSASGLNVPAEHSFTGARINPFRKNMEKCSCRNILVRLSQCKNREMFLREHCGKPSIDCCVSQQREARLPLSCNFCGAMSHERHSGLCFAAFASHCY